MMLASGNSDDEDKKVTQGSAEIANRRGNGVTQGLIGGILIASFLPAVASATEKQPSVSENEPLQARVAKIKQSFSDSSASGRISAPGPMWYDWNNWPNWGNWNNWPNWSNWLNW
jgi:hypothetical protein